MKQTWLARRGSGRVALRCHEQARRAERECYTGALMTVAPEQEGWIGRWSPGIGDPNVAGWLTVVLYLAAALACFWVARDIRRREGVAPLTRREFWLWGAFSILLGLLGVNKQLDLQTALTELGRMLARDQGWYARRAHVQKEFIAGLCVLAVVAGAALFMLLRRQGRHAKMAALGICFIGFFVLIRASSFHKVDNFLGSRLVHLRMNWILEMGGVFVVLLAGLGRLRAFKSRSH
jgi:hypothetical protein